MKINGQNLGVDLIAQMQDIHKTEKAQSSSKTFDLSKTEFTKASPSDAPSSLDGKLRVTAEKALKGEFKNENELRLEVISTIVEDRFDGILNKRSEKKKLLKGLEETLLNDPEFGNQIDDMMLMAARDLGRR